MDSIQNPVLDLVHTEVGFLSRSPTYQTVKPYSLRYDPNDDSPRDNVEIEMRKITVRDARKFKPTIDGNGFTLTSIPSCMQYQDFENPLRIERTYVAEIQSHLKSIFNACHARVIDYAVRSPVNSALKSQRNYFQTDSKRLIRTDSEASSRISNLDRRSLRKPTASFTRSCRSVRETAPVRNN